MTIFNDLRNYFDFLGLIKDKQNMKETTHNLLILTSFLTELKGLNVLYCFPPGVSSHDKLVEQFIIDNSMQILKNRLSKALQKEIIFNVDSIQNNIIKDLLQKHKLCKKFNIGLVLPKKKTEEGLLASPEINIKKKNKKDIDLDF